MSETLTEIHTDLTWTPEAWDQFKKIRDRAFAIRGSWGDQLGDRAFASIGHCLASVLASGPTRVHRDGEGLIFYTPHIVMGMVFHSDSAQFMADHIAADCTAEEVEACLTFAPTSGEWSLHS